MYNFQKTKQGRPLPMVISLSADLFEEKALSHAGDDFSVRPYRSSDRTARENLAAVSLHESADITAHAVKTDPSFRKDAIFMLCRGDLSVGTVRAAYQPEYGRDCGYLTEFFLDPNLCDAPAAACLVREALKKVWGTGRKKAILCSWDFHVIEIKAALLAGFAPAVFSDEKTEQKERWDAVLTALGEILPEAGYPEVPLHGQRINKDNPERTEARSLWVPDRSPRDTGESMDCYADESLYHSAELGTSDAWPLCAAAGSSCPLTFTYTCGKRELPAGTRVCFAMRGQSTLGTAFQCVSAEDSGFFTIQSDGSAKLKPFYDPSNVAAGFVIGSGSLTEGDTVTISVRNFDRTPIADTYDCYTVIRLPGESVSFRLPEHIVFTVLPEAFDSMEAFLPMTFSAGTALSLSVRARDRFDNPVKKDGGLSVSFYQNDTFLGETKEQLHGGHASVSFLPEKAFCEGDVLTAKVLLQAPEGAQFSAVSNPSLCVPAGGLYLGDMHCHDCHSEAWGYPENVYTWARDEKRMDFISLSIQAHGYLSNEKWAVHKYLTERFNDEGRFVTLLANEWQHSGYGDKIIHFLGGDQPYFCSLDERYNSAARLYEGVRATDAFIISHHMAYRDGEWCPATTFEDLETDVDRLVELWSMHGSSEGFDDTDRPLRHHTHKNTAMEAIKAGLRVGFTAGSDTHSGRPGGSAKEPLGYWGGMVAVWADSLERKDIFDAFRARHTYALTDRRIVLKMTVNDALMGSEIPFAESVRIRIDAVAPEEISCIHLMKNGELYDTIKGSGSAIHLQRTESLTNASCFHCRIVTKSGSLAVCSPVWVG